MESKASSTNFELLRAIRLSGKTQGQVVREGGLQNETRLSRIIRGYIKPTEDEIAKICGALGATRGELGFTDAN